MVYTDGVHLIADSEDELHAFAEKIGMKREWHQEHDRHPHYDIWGSMVNRATLRGAVMVTSKKVIELCSRNLSNTKV